jgi:hypothetical protein
VNEFQCIDANREQKSRALNSSTDLKHTLCSVRENICIEKTDLKNKQIVSDIPLRQSNRANLKSPDNPISGFRRRRNLMENCQHEL